MNERGRGGGGANKRVFKKVHQGVQGVSLPGKVCPRSSGTNKTKRTKKRIVSLIQN